MSLFDQRLLAEGVRIVEGDSPVLSPTLSPTALADNAASFETLLLQRAMQLDSQLDSKQQISVLFLHFKRLIKNLFTCLSLLLVVLGALSVQQLFFSEQGTQINFFWALALFFIPNFLTLLLWALFFLHPALLHNSWLMRCSVFICKTVEKRVNADALQHAHFWPLFSCYFKVFFSGRLGRYQLSCLTHQLWLSYFCGACVMLVLMLATHQVDFIWQTSILSSTSFQWLTELLAYLPNLLGFLVPTPEQIQASHLSALNALASVADAQNSRLAWSVLLISSFILYGVAPRFILLLLMRFLLKANKKKFTLNLSSAYYVQLRQHLKPSVTSLGISDPDTRDAAPARSHSAKMNNQPLPSSFYPVALELSASQFIACEKHVQQVCPAQFAKLTHVCDFQSQQALLQGGASSDCAGIVLYVALARLPDRGLLGFIRELRALSGHAFYLLLMGDAVSDKTYLDKRRSDWFALAAQADIPLDNIIEFQCIK